MWAYEIPFNNKGSPILWTIVDGSGRVGVNSQIFHLNQDMFASWTMKLSHDKWFFFHGQIYKRCYQFY